MSAGDQNYWTSGEIVDFTIHPTALTAEEIAATFALVVTDPVLTWSGDNPTPEPGGIVLATEAEHGPFLGATHAVSICIGPETIERLTRGEAVEVNGVTLYAADGLLNAPDGQDEPRLADADLLAELAATPLSDFDSFPRCSAPTDHTTQIDAVHALLHANRNHAPTREFAAEVVEAVLRAGEG